MNRLAKETSPYLRQHARNPVHWYPWGPEALERARREDRPILLSVGYSACHWCHVMAHESFEREETARLMNESFVNIKVDREERPDLDRIYQTVAQLFTGGGGWPLTVFLTPDLRPFFGGTYFPPEDRWGRPGFPRLLEGLRDAYAGDRASVLENAGRIMDVIRGADAREAGAPSTGALGEAALGRAAARAVEAIDWSEGGFLGAPKFPMPTALTFLQRAGELLGVPRAREAVILTLDKMADGGIYDHLGGGFHRYSVDDRWAVPHFEKMLYDNALLLGLYAEALLEDPTRMPSYGKVLRETIDYLLREMRSPQGMFFAAQDADSEGEEGKFFVWTPAELGEVLEAADALAFAARYGVSEAGNFEGGGTVLAVSRGWDEVKRILGCEESEAWIRVETARAKLFAVRKGRIAPGLDDKVLVSWNGLVVSGLLWASHALDRGGDSESASRAREAALLAYDAVRKGARTGEGRLAGTVRSGAARFNGTLDDYAFMARAAFDVARFSGEPGRIEQVLADAAAWLKTIVDRFGPGSAGAFHFTSDDHEALVHRPRGAQDQATPAGSSVALQCLLVAEACGLPGHDWGSEARNRLAVLSSVAGGSPLGFGELLSSALLAAKGVVAVARMPATVSPASPSGAQDSSVHPHVFQSRGVGDAWQICHRGTCTGPFAAAEQAWAEARARAVVVS